MRCLHGVWLGPETHCPPVKNIRLPGGTIHVDTVLNGTFIIFVVAPMSIEGFAKQHEPRKSREPNTVVIRATDSVVRELTSDGALERKSRAAQRIVERILSANNQGKKVVVAGETRTIAAWIDEVKVGFAEMR